MQSDGLLGDARGVFQKLQFIDQLVAFQLMLSTEGVRIGAFLNLAVTKAERGETGATCIACLIDETADRGNKDLAVTREHQRRLRERDARVPSQFCIDGEQQRQVAIHRNGKRIDANGRRPFDFVLLLGRERDVVLFRKRARLRDFDRQRRRGFDTAGA